MMPNLHEEGLFTAKEHFALGAHRHFPIWNCGVYFRDTSIVIEHCVPPDPKIPTLNGEVRFTKDLLEIIFPAGFSILRTGPDHIVYGVVDEIEIMYTHKKTGEIKAQYTIFTEKWLKFSMTYRVELAVQEEPYKTGAMLTNSKGDNITTLSDKITIVPPSEDFVKCNITGDSIDFIITSKDEKYPIIFDPTILIGSTLYGAGYLAGTIGRGRHCCRLSTGRIYVSYWRSSTTFYCAYSDDDGKTWAEESVGASAAAGYGSHCIIVNSADKLWYFYSTKSAGGNYGLAYRTKTVSGAWTAEAFVCNEYAAVPFHFPDAAIGGNGVPQVVFYYDGLTARYTNSAHYTWPETAAGNQSLQVSDLGIGYTPTICVGAMAGGMANDAHIVWCDNTGKRLSYKMYDYSVPSLGARVDLDVTGTTNYDLQWPYIIGRGSDGTLWISYQNLRTPQAGISNIRFVYYDGAAWVAAVNITNVAYHQYYSCINWDSGGNLWVHWQGQNADAVYYIWLSCGGTTSPPVWTGCQLICKSGINVMNMPNTVESYEFAYPLQCLNMAFVYIDATASLVLWRDWQPPAQRPFLHPAILHTMATTGFAG